MFKTIRRLMLFFSGTGAALLVLHYLNERQRNEKPAAKVTTEIKVDEVKPASLTAQDVAGSTSKKRTIKNEPSPAAVSVDEHQDDLKKIEGIGPKTAEILVQSGITNFEILSRKSSSEIKEILRAAKGRGVPDTWPEQARLAAAGDWQSLAELQIKLKGGLSSSA